MNLYDILEVSENASQEVINKVYKIQAKRYHPDLQKSEEEKIKAEEKMKKINEAYAILSDSNKRFEYDEKLKSDRKAKEQQIYNNMVKKYNSQTEKKENERVEKKVYTREDYYRDYNKKLRKNNFEKWKRKMITNIETIGIMIVILIILWLFPPTHKMIINLYEENIIIKALVDGTINSIKTLFKV